METQHTIFMSTKSCKIECHLCERELIDRKDRQQVFQLRKIFFEKKQIQDETTVLNQKIFKNFQFPQNNLQATLFLLYSTPYIRKMFKKGYISHNYIKRKFGKEIFPEIYKNLSKTIFHMNKKEYNPQIIGQLYQSLIKVNEKFGSYEKLQIGDYFNFMLELIDKQSNELRYSDDVLACGRSLGQATRKQLLEQGIIQKNSLSKANFGGQFQIKKKCKLCQNNFETKKNFFRLNFKIPDKNQWKLIKKLRKIDYYDLLPTEAIPKKKGIFKSFFQQTVKKLGFFDVLFYYLSDQDNHNKSSFYCNSCKLETNCETRSLFKEFPQYLTISLKRQYDPIDYILEQNLDFSNFVDRFNSDLGFGQKQLGFQYNLKSIVVEQEEENIVYTKLKNKWIKCSRTEIEETYLKDFIKDVNPTLIIYERQKEISSLQKNILSQMKIKNSFKDKIETLSVPNYFIFELLYLNRIKKFSLDGIVCKHGSIKPTVLDVYPIKHNKKIHQSLQFSFYEKKKFNKNLSEIEKPSFSVLQFLSSSTALPKPIAEFLYENFHVSLQGSFSIQKTNFNKQCEVCLKKERDLMIRRIIEKALFMSLNSTNIHESSMKYYLDKNWLTQYKQFLLSDFYIQEQDFQSIFINQSPKGIIKISKQNINVDKETQKKKLEQINGIVLYSLKQLYEVKKVGIQGIDQEIAILKEVNYKKLQNQISEVQKFTINFLKEKEFDFSEKEIQDLLELNNKMNTMIQFKNQGMYKFFKIPEIKFPILNQKFCRKLKQVFNTNDIDNLAFDPCSKFKKIIKGLIDESGFIFKSENQNKTKPQNIRDSLYEAQKNNKEFERSQHLSKQQEYKESTVIKSIDAGTLNDIFAEQEKKKTQIQKTRTMIENIQLSDEEDQESQLDKHRLSIETMNKSQIKKLSKITVKRLSRKSEENEFDISKIELRSLYSSNNSPLIKKDEQDFDVTSFNNSVINQEINQQKGQKLSNFSDLSKNYIIDVSQIGQEFEEDSDIDVPITGQSIQKQKSPTQILQILNQETDQPPVRRTKKSHFFNTIDLRLDTEEHSSEQTSQEDQEIQFQEDKNQTQNEENYKIELKIIKKKQRFSIRTTARKQAKKYIQDLIQLKSDRMSQLSNRNVSLIKQDEVIEQEMKEDKKLKQTFFLIIKKEPLKQKTAIINLASDQKESKITTFEKELPQIQEEDDLLFKEKVTNSDFIETQKPLMDKLQQSQPAKLQDKENMYQLRNQRNN